MTSRVWVNTESDLLLPSVQRRVRLDITASHEQSLTRNGQSLLLIIKTTMGHHTLSATVYDLEEAIGIPASPRHQLLLWQ